MIIGVTFYDLMQGKDSGLLNPSATYTAVYTVDADGKIFFTSKTFKLKVKLTD